MISDLDDYLEITVKLDEKHQGFKNYKILKAHKNSVESLDVSYDKTTNTVTFKTNQLSTFVLTYETAKGFNWWWLILIIILIIVITYVIYHNYPTKASNEDNTNPKPKEVVANETKKIASNTNVKKFQ